MLKLFAISFNFLFISGCIPKRMQIYLSTFRKCSVSLYWNRNCIWFFSLQKYAHAFGNSRRREKSNRIEIILQSVFQFTLLSEVCVCCCSSKVTIWYVIHASNIHSIHDTKHDTICSLCYFGSMLLVISPRYCGIFVWRLLFARLKQLHAVEREKEYQSNKIMTRANTIGRYCGIFICIK